MKGSNNALSLFMLLFLYLCIPLFMGLHNNVNAMKTESFIQYMCGKEKSHSGIAPLSYCANASERLHLVKRDPSVPQRRYLGERCPEPVAKAVHSILHTNVLEKRDPQLFGEAEMIRSLWGSLGTYASEGKPRHQGVYNRIGNWMTQMNSFLGVAATPRTLTPKRSSNQNNSACEPLNTHSNELMKTAMATNGENKVITLNPLTVVHYGCHPLGSQQYAWTSLLNQNTIVQDGTIANNEAESSLSPNETYTSYEHGYSYDDQSSWDPEEAPEATGSNSKIDMFSQPPQNVLGKRKTNNNNEKLYKRSVWSNNINVQHQNLEEKEEGKGKEPDPHDWAHDVLFSLCPCICQN